MIQKLCKSIREYKKDTILTPILVLLEVVMEIVIPLLMAALIDYGIDQGNMNGVLKYGGLLLLCAVLALGFGAAAGGTAASAAAGFTKNLRKDMYNKIQEFSFSNIDKFSTASIVTRLTTDATNVQNAFQMVIRMVVRSPIMMFSALAVSFSINAKLALIFLGCIPVLAIGLYLIIRNVHPLFTKVFRTYDKLNSVVQENLLGIRVVKSYVREDREKEKFDSISQEIFQDFSKAEKIIAFNMPFMQFCMYACMLLVSWFGARAIVACGGDPALGLSTGQLMSLITYAMQILMSLMVLSMVFVMVTMSEASAKRIVEILDEESDLRNPENPILEVADGSIELRDVSFRYSTRADKPCLSHISLSIKSGETVGIIGGTGSSKSSLVQLIPRLYDVSSGAVLVGGADVRQYDLETLRSQVAMVLQKNVLFSGTISENLRWGDETASDQELERVCRLAQAHEFIEGFPEGYNTYIEQGGSNVSGGQKQRLCIARALLRKPKILILDDSTSAVDTRTDALIRRAFAEEIPHTTKLIIAQRISSVQDADKIIVMDDGKISAVGTHQELMKESLIYREVYESQTKGGDENEQQ